MILSLIKTAPSWLLFIFLGFLIAIVSIPLIYHYIKTIQLLFFLNKLNRSDDTEEILKRNSFSKLFLSYHTKILERFAAKNGSKVLYLLDIDKIWINLLKKRKSKKNLLRIINFIPETGIFYFFKYSLEKNRLLKVFKIWIENQAGKQAIIEKIASLSNGICFDGKKAYRLFLENIQVIENLSKSEDQNQRYFALKILMNKNSASSNSFCIESYNDTSYIVRKTVLNEYVVEPIEKHYELLLKVLLNDPLQELRDIAYKKIMLRYKNLFYINKLNLNEYQILHLINTLDFSKKENIKFALNNTLTNNPEISYGLIKVLEKSGILKKIFLSKGSFIFNKDIIDKALSVGINSFLKYQDKIKNINELISLVAIIDKYSLKKNSVLFVKKIFNNYSISNSENLFNIVFKFINKNQSQETSLYLNSVLLSKKYSNQLKKYILNNIADNQLEYIIDGIWFLFFDKSFPYRDDISLVLKKAPEHLIFDRVFEVLNYSSSNYTDEIKIEMLELITSKNFYCCVESILESLEWVTFENRKIYSLLLSKLNKNKFNNSVNYFLKIPDNAIKASIISTLTTNGDQQYFDIPVKFLKDKDPKVRISAIWGLVDIGDERSLDKAVEMLYDAEENVRVEAARSLAMHGTLKILSRLKKILFDDNEPEAIKVAVINGLADSKHTGSIEILLNMYEPKNSLSNIVLNALLGKRSKKDILKYLKLYEKHYENGNYRELINNIFSENFNYIKSALLNTLKLGEYKKIILEILTGQNYFFKIADDINVNDRFELLSTIDDLLEINCEEGLVAVINILNKLKKDKVKRIVNHIKKSNKKNISRVVKTIKNLNNLDSRKFKYIINILKDLLQF